MPNAPETAVPTDPAPSVELDRSPVPRYAELLHLTDRCFIVVGGGQGIGRQTCHALHAAGARVVCVDVVAERAQAVTEEVDGLAWTGSPTTVAGAAELLAFVMASVGRVDGVVDIVGGSTFANVVDMTPELWASEFDHNINHCFAIAHVFGAHLARSGGGSLVYISSVAGLQSSVRHAAYGAAKAGLMSLVKSLAEELGGSGVRVNSVAPGAVLTPRMQAKLPAHQQAISAQAAPLGRMAQPADIAAAVLFLSSDLASFITGQTLVVDGGATIRFAYRQEF